MRMLVLALLLSCATMVFAQAQVTINGVEQGTVKGVVKLEDGTPCVNTGVTVAITHPTSSAMTSVSTGVFTGAGGVFTIKIAAGTGEVKIPGVSAPVTIIAGQVCEVTLTVPTAHGAFLQVNNADITPFNGKIRTAFHAPGGDGKVEAIHISNGRFFVPGIPANATGLSLLCERWDGRFNCVSRRIFPFTEQANVRTLTSTLPPTTHARVKVTDEQGRPVAKERLSYILTYTSSATDYFWDDDHAGPPQQSYCNTADTDRQGLLDLGVLPAQQYYLTIDDGDYAGAATGMTVTDNGEISLKGYTMLTTGRHIIQTVFDAAGKPLPAAEVHASYCWGGKISYRIAISDQSGKVAWDDLPPVRVIVYGPHIAAGVIAADATEVTAPLPAPTPEQPVGALQLAIFEQKLGDLNYIIADGTAKSVSDMRLGSCPKAMYIQAPIPTGTLLSLLVYDNNTPQGYNLLGEYMPYVEGGDRNVAFTPENFTAGAQLNGSFLLPDGTPLTHRCTLQLAPVQLQGAGKFLQLLNSHNEYDITTPDGMSKLMESTRGRISFLEKACPSVEAHDDGSFTVKTLFSGTYRLRVYLKEQPGEADFEKIIEIKPGVSQQVIRL